MEMQFIDIHCHCLAGIDDGPADWEQSLSLCRVLAAEGVKTVVATPHQLGRFGNPEVCEKIRNLTAELNHRLVDTGIDLAVLPGAEVHLDERIPLLLEKDCILTLADGKRYLLLELSPDIRFDITPLVERLVSGGIRPVIAHLERCLYLNRCAEVLSKWISAGVLGQVTASALVGMWGRDEYMYAWQLIYNGQAAAVATDAHDTQRRPPLMDAAFNEIRRWLGNQAAETLCFENPLRIISGKETLAVSDITHQPVHENRNI